MKLEAVALAVTWLWLMLEVLVVRRKRINTLTVLAALASTVTLSRVLLLLWTLP